MADTNESCCPECGGWLQEKDGFKRCSCGYARKVVKREIIPGWSFRCLGF